MSKKKITTDAINTPETATTPYTPPVVEGRPVIVCTEQRAVLFGYATDTSGTTVNLKRARMAIYWGTTKGVMELAEDGPNTKSKISARADGEFRNVIAVFEVTPQATKAWEEAV